MSPTRLELSAALERAFADDIPSWLPGFAPALAEAEWDRLRSWSGITPETYGTARIRASGDGAERDIQSVVPFPSAFGRTGGLLVETLRPGPEARYKEVGLDLASPEAAGSATITARVKGGLKTIASIPSIAASVGSVLHVLHVAVPEGPDYDVSYSDPEVPFSIFVGISRESGSDPVADLRLAEGILHESMHLQLTLVEEVLPLIADETVHHYSPWQDTMRPARGVLHGIYVFAVIRDFMTAIAAHPASTESARRHAQERIATATDEIDEVSRPLMEGPALSQAGRNLLCGAVVKAEGHS